LLYKFNGASMHVLLLNPCIKTLLLERATTPTPALNGNLVVLILLVLIFLRGKLNKISKFFFFHS
jgi:hypothetical protein